jgi:hypothetical protein
MTHLRARELDGQAAVVAVRRQRELGQHERPRANDAFGEAAHQAGEAAARQRQRGEVAACAQRVEHEHPDRGRRRPAAVEGGGGGGGGRGAGSGNTTRTSAVTK